jgi:hypothetical protein
LRRARLATSGNADADQSSGSDTAHPTTAAAAAVTPEQWGCVRPKGQETAHSEDKPHRNSRLAEDKAGSRHANTAPTEALYKPASAGHVDIKPASLHAEARRTPLHADGKPAVSHGEAKATPPRADVKASQRADAKSTPPRADIKPSKPASQHGEAKPPTAQTDKARVGTAKNGTGT